MRAFIVLAGCLFVSATAFSQQMLREGMAAADTTAIKCPMHSFPSFTSRPVNNEQAIPQNFYAQHLGFFCRQELKMQQVHVPVTFRLGSMDDCNRLEQKPGYR